VHFFKYIYGQFALLPSLHSLSYTTRILYSNGPYDDCNEDVLEKKLISMLGNAPLFFVKKPTVVRRRIYMSHLVAKTPIRILGDSLDEHIKREYPEIHDGYFLLRREKYAGQQHAQSGKQIAREARETLYSENAFVVSSHCIGEFLVDSLEGMADGGLCHIGLLIQVLEIRAIRRMCGIERHMVSG
jgi:hypothetical protein